jgi:hypothetical protein
MERRPTPSERLLRNLFDKRHQIVEYVRLHIKPLGEDRTSPQRVLRLCVRSLNDPRG